MDGTLVCSEAFEINSHHTELVCSQYDDRTFIIVTQYNKLVTLPLFKEVIIYDDWKAISA